MNRPYITLSTHDNPRPLDESFVVETNDSTGAINRNSALYTILIFKSFSILKSQDVIKLLDRPTSRKTLLELRLLPARKPKPHEPLAVDFLGHVFQQGDAAFVVFDQVVIGRQQTSDLFLLANRRVRNYQPFCIRHPDMLNRRPRSQCRNLSLQCWTKKRVVKESLVQVDPISTEDHRPLTKKYLVISSD